MRKISATEASRRFSELLDTIEAGGSVTVTRGNRAIAEIRPVRRRTGRDLRMALEGISPPDDRFVDDIADAVVSLNHQEADPWAGR